MGNLIDFFENIKISSFCNVISAIGVFDGIHNGHREIIRRARIQAEKEGGKVLALSFLPHPRQILTPDNPPQLLLPPDERVRLLKEAGADFCAFINFTKQAAQMSAEEFLQKLTEESRCRISGICVGSSWRFGQGGKGNRELLEKFCREHNWSFNAVDELTFENKVISATAIRHAIAAGELDCAEKMCGRKAALYGKVEKGFQIASQKLAAPTANLAVSYGVLPPDGVYGGRVKLEGKIYPAAVNIGVAPTFGNGLRRVEVHLIGFTGSLYGREICVELHSFLRKERFFSSPEELKKQIAADIEAIMRNHCLQNS